MKNEKMKKACKMKKVQHELVNIIIIYYLFHFFPKLQLQKNKRENIHNVTIMLQIMLQH